MLYPLSKMIFGPLLKKLFQMEIVGTEHIPANGPCLLAANHCSYLDPFWLGAACPRKIHYLMLGQFYHHPLLHWYCWGIGAIPVSPEGGTLQLIRACIRLLEASHIVGIFPEGARSNDGRTKPFKPGVLRLAQRLGTRIVPAGIRGGFEAFPQGQRIPRLSKIGIAFGPPMAPPPQGAGERELLSLSEGLRATIRTLAGLQDRTPP